MTIRSYPCAIFLTLIILTQVFSFICYPISLNGEDFKDSFITVIDSLERPITVPKNPQRIVPLTTSATELIRLLGAMDRVVGTTSIVRARNDLIPDISQLPDVGRGFTPNLEVLVRLAPDLVIAWSDYPPPEVEKQLKTLGINFLRLDLMLPGDFYRETEELALILGGDAPQRAESFLGWYRDLETSLRESITKSSRKKPTVLAEESGMGHIAGATSGAYGVILHAQGEYLAPFIPGRAGDVNVEWIFQTNPEYFIKVYRFTGGLREDSPRYMEDMRREVITRDGWENMRAVKEEKVRVLDNDICGGPRNMIGIYTVANWFYPDLVSSGKALRIKTEYFQRFQEIGVFNDPKEQK
ncbi:MAG: ABC transporter substrate-binding protein [Deltaproteobacteria bacterium]|jgi:iron complex transport system substrate-binding protein|nr:ABC transporter substrate-binding protein [Deltaproteobacteria bacterium]